MLKKLLCLLCVGILLTGCGQPTKNDQKEGNVEKKSEEALSTEETLVKSLKDASYVAGDGKKADIDVKNYVSMKNFKKDNVTFDVFVFNDDISARKAFEAKLDEDTEQKNNVVVTMDATKNNEALGYVTKNNLVVRVKMTQGNTADLGKLFSEFGLPR